MIYALLGLLGFGIADYLVIYLTRWAGYIKGIFWNTFFLLAYLLLLSFVFGTTSGLFHLGAINLLSGLVAGVISTIGGLSYFQGTKIGNLSVLAPIASSYSIVVILFSVIFLTEKLGFVQVLSIIIILVGTILISTDLKKLKNLKFVISDKAAPFGFRAMLFWGVAFIFIGDLTLKIGWLNANIIVTFSSLLFLIIYCFYKEKGYLLSNTKTYGLAAFVSIFSAMGFAGYSLGVSSTYASIVAPVVAAAPVVTVILALLLLKEKLAKEQSLGVLLLIAGMIGLAI